MLAACDDRMMVAADYPGYGMSDRPPSIDDASIESYARAMWSVVDALKLGPIDLLGHHTGSKTAIEMARQRPDDVRGIAMISAAILTDKERAQFSSMFEPIPLDREGTRHQENWRRIVAVAAEGWPLEMMDRSYLQTLMGGEAYEWGHHAAFGHTTPFTDGLRDLPHRKVVLNLADSLQDCTRRVEGVMTNGELIECPQWTFGFLDMYPGEVADLVKGRLDAR